MGFIHPNFLRGTIKAPFPPGKQSILKADVNMTFLLAQDLGRVYKVVYALSIITKTQRLAPQTILTPSMINMFSLRNAILANVSEYDKKYMELIKFDTMKVEFYFKHEKWFEDALRGTQPVTELSRFSRTFKLKVRVPGMIFHDFTSIPFEKFIIRKFREYMEKKRTAAKWFRHLFPTEMRQRLQRSLATRMFNFNYDIQWNTVKITLKPLYILGLIYAIGLVAKKLSKRDIESSYKRGMFAIQVKKHLKKFDRAKWEMYIRRRFI